MIGDKATWLAGGCRRMAGVAALAVTGCVAAGNREGPTAADPELAYCRDPRPQVCIQLYDPVCARLGDGGERTFSNACSACSDPAVLGYRPDACN